jgi:hypothetical protein
LDWNAIGAIGEVVGAAGVVFSLVYLATQIRSSSKQANADAVYNLQKGQADVMETLSSSAELAKLLAKLERGDPLEIHEEIQIDFLVARVTGIFAAVQAAANSGIVDKDYLEDSNIGLSIFATRFRLANRMWRYSKRAHESVSHGRVFNKLRLAAEASQT